MRVSIPKGFHQPIQKLMQQLQTDDPALAVNHVIGCWLASNGCPGHAIATSTSSVHQPSVSPAADEFADIIEF
jgi:hypothetical protein